MRKVALVLAGLVAGAAISWSVAVAQDQSPPLTTLCTRAGADVRSPAANGTCPSGYTKVAIPAPAQVFTRDVGQSLSFTVSFRVPTGGARTGATVQAVVVAPDGTLTVGPVRDASVAALVMKDTLTIPDPQRGTWHVGAQWAGGNTFIPIGDLPNGDVEVVSSRGTQVTRLDLPDMHQEPNVGAVQMLADFAYFAEIPPFDPGA